VITLFTEQLVMILLHFTSEKLLKMFRNQKRGIQMADGYKPTVWFIVSNQQNGPVRMDISFRITIMKGIIILFMGILGDKLGSKE
jgi:hypothetical protein